MQLRRFEAAANDIAALDQRIDDKLEPYRSQHALLTQICGVDWLVAAVLIAEIGIDMSVFVSVCHLAAWAGVCPGNYESAGERKSSRTRKGNFHRRTTQVGARRSPRQEPKAATSGTSSIASRPAADHYRPRSPSPTGFSSRPTTC